MKYELLDQPVEELEELPELEERIDNPDKEAHEAEIRKLQFRNDESRAEMERKEMGAAEQYEEVEKILKNQLRKNKKYKREIAELKARLSKYERV